MSFVGQWSAVRRIGLWAGVIALLFQSLAWSITLPTRSIDADWATICSADGLVRVHVDADGAPAGEDEPAPHAGTGSCPLCPLIGGLSLPPPFAEPVSPQVLARHDPVGLPGDRIAAGWFLSTLQARAPPSIG